MALTGLQIFKLLPKTNCKECGHPTCMAFSMALASAKIALDACPYVSDEAKEALGSASAPPVAKIVYGKDAKAREMGDETVLFRHDKQFFHPSCIAACIADDDAEFDAKLEKINGLKFERVGEQVEIDGIALCGKSGNADTFAAKAKVVAEKGAFAPILVSTDVGALTKAVEAIKDSRPLIYGADDSNWEAVANLAKANDCPLVVTAADIDSLSALTDKVGAITKNLVVATSGDSLVQSLADLTQIRRQAIRKKVRPLGYPSAIKLCGKDRMSQVAAASSFVAKYGSLIIMDTYEKADILPLMALRQNLFSDPQKPAQVEPGCFPIGDANENSPVYCTTNFSLTYYTVEGEISSSKIPSWLIAIPTDGTSVLTAWAAGKFNGDKIAEYFEENKLGDKFPKKRSCYFRICSSP
jgi:acetyl-CoA decarbonylase/synthase complex subunit gamma